MAGFTSPPLTARRRAVFSATLVAGAALLPLIWLLDADAIFDPDWLHHQTLIAYHGEHLRAHGVPPGVVHTPDLVGVPQPVFYGYLFYPLLGAVSAITGARLALPLACGALALWQAAALGAAARRIGIRGWAGFLVVVSPLWSTYSLTNLYSRSALAEYFAGGLAVAAVGWLAAAGAGPDGGYRRRCLVAAALSLVLLGGTHPTSALLAAVVLGVPLVLTLPLAAAPDRSTLTFAAGLIVAGAVVLGPWLGACVAEARNTAIYGGFPQLAFFPERLDQWLVRLRPWPFDPGTPGPAATAADVPHLDTQVNVPLLLWWSLLAVMLWRLRGHGQRLHLALAVTAGGVFLLLLSLSCASALSPWLTALGPYVQFAYRLVGFCNLAITAGVLTAARALGPGLQETGRWQGVALACLGLAAAGLMIKLHHSREVGQLGSTAPWVEAHRGRMGGVESDYATPRLVPSLPASAGEIQRVAIPWQRDGSRFGATDPVRFNLAAPAWIITNIQVFPWNTVWLDGRQVPPDHLRQRERRFAVQAGAGPHTLHYEFRPAAWLPGARTLSLLTFGGLLLAGLVAASGVIREEGRRSG